MAVWSAVNLSDLGHAQRLEAEYYKPDYLALDETLNRVCASPINRYLDYLTDGTHITPRYVSDGIPFLSSSDVDPFLLPDVIQKFISQTEHDGLRHCQPMAKDVLMSKSGRIGSCAVVPDDVSKGDWNIYEGIAILRLSEIDPHYAAAFLNSRFGFMQVRRELKGVAQPHLHLEDIRRLKIFVPANHEQIAIRDIVAAGVRCARESYRAYSEGQGILRAKIGLTNLKLGDPISDRPRYTSVHISETYGAQRFDAQCFTHDGVSVEDWLSRNVQCMQLRSLVGYGQKGMKQAESAAGTYPYCTIKHIAGRELVRMPCCQPSHCAPFALRSDLLLAITGATIGKVGIVHRYSELTYSGDLLRLRASEAIDPYYLLLVLDSPIGEYQFKRWITGSTNGHLAPRELGRILIPRLGKEVEGRLSDFVILSLRMRLESERLLDQATTRVEQLIEAAAA